MGLLDAIKNKKEDETVEITLDEEKCLQAWTTYLDSYLKKHDIILALEKRLNEIAGQQNLSNRDPLVLAAASQEIITAMTMIQALIPPELVEMDDVKKSELEIKRLLARIQTFSTVQKENNAASKLNDKILHEERKIDAIYENLARISSVAKAELHLANTIGEQPQEYATLGIRLYSLIVTIEFTLTTVHRHWLTREAHAETQQLVHRIIIGERLKEQLKSTEEAMIARYKEIMGNQDSGHDIRMLALTMEEELTRMVNWDADDASAQLQKLIGSDNILVRIIYRFNPRYSKTQIRAIIAAYRAATPIM